MHKNRPMPTPTKIKGIMLVDDDFITNHLNSELLQEMQISDHVVVCYSGEEAIEYLHMHHSTQTNEKSVELIFLDINMPGMDGFDFLEWLRKTELSAGIEVVLLTTSDNPKDLQRAEQFKIKGYLNKPLTEEKIGSVITSLNSGS